MLLLVDFQLCNSNKHCHAPPKKLESTKTSFLYIYIFLSDQKRSPNHQRQSVVKKFVIKNQKSWNPDNRMLSKKCVEKKSESPKPVYFPTMFLR